MIRFESTAVRYADGTTALRSVSFSVPRGQFCVVLGSSGAGKSTLLRTINGLVTPTHGRVYVDGTAVEPRTLPAIRPRIGMVHQQFNLVPRASVATNVLCGALPVLPAWRALLARFPAHLRARACQLVAAVGLQPEHLQRRASDLSGGQQQRVGIARAFMLAPALLLADEPVASLDPRISRDIMDLLRAQAREQQATVLCSLHQVDLAREYADRIVALRHGAVAFDGPAASFDDAAAQALYGPADATHSARPRPDTAISDSARPHAPIPAASVEDAGLPDGARLQARHA